MKITFIFVNITFPETTTQTATLRNGIIELREHSFKFKISLFLLY